MIVGKLVDLYRYKGIAKNIDTAIDYVLNNDLMALPKGKTVVDGDNVFINRDTYIANDLEKCFYENHENYIDLQIVLNTFNSLEIGSKYEIISSNNSIF